MRYVISSRCDALICIIAPQGIDADSVLSLRLHPDWERCHKIFLL